MLAAFLEHPLLEVAHRSTEGSRECDRPPSLLGECEELPVESTGEEKTMYCSCLGEDAATPTPCLDIWLLRLLKIFQTLNIRGISESPKTI